MAGLGIALGSGGARGWCHIGVLYALKRLGVQPELVAGSSMGALVGAAYAGGRLAALEDWARGLTRARFLRLLDMRLSGGGLVGGGEILRVLEELRLPDRIEDLPMPFIAVTADMETGREVWLRKGPLAEAVRASVALPGVLRPHRLDGHWYLDGGLVNPVPVSALSALGASATIAVGARGHPDGVIWSPAPDAADAGHRSALLSVLPQEVAARFAQSAPAPSYLEVLSSALNIMMDELMRRRLMDEAPDVMLDAELPGMQMLEFWRAAEAIAEGARIVEARAPAIRALV